MSKKKTLGDLLSTSTEKLNDALLSYDRQMKAYEELLLVRDLINTNQLTDELAKFIDHHGELSEIINKYPLPTQSNIASCEALQVAEMQFVDAAVEGLLQSIKETIKAIYMAFLEWLKNWYDENRRMYFRLQRHQTRLKNDPMKYGDEAAFAKAKGNVYKYSEWKSMYEASKAIGELIKSVSKNNPGKFFDDKRDELVKNLYQFGYSITQGGIVCDKPRYIKNERLIGQSGAGWSRGGLLDNVSRSMSNLKNEESSRNEFVELKRAFDAAIAGEPDQKDRNALIKLVRVSKLSKDFARIVARAVVDVCNIALRSA